MVLKIWFLIVAIYPFCGLCCFGFFSLVGSYDIGLYSIVRPTWEFDYCGSATIACAYRLQIVVDLWCEHCRVDFEGPKMRRIIALLTRSAAKIDVMDAYGLRIVLVLECIRLIQRSVRGDQGLFYCRSIESLAADSSRLYHGLWIPFWFWGAGDDMSQNKFNLYNHHCRLRPHTHLCPPVESSPTLTYGRRNDN